MIGAPAKRVPTLLWPCAALLLGCALGPTRHNIWPIVLMLGIAALILAAISRSAAVAMIAVSLIALAFGIWRALLPTPAPLIWPAAPTNAVRGAVTEWPVTHGEIARARVTVFAARTDTGWVRADATLRATLPAYPPVGRGDVVVIGGVPTIRHGWWPDADGTLYGQWARVERADDTTTAADVRHRIIGGLRDAIERNIRAPESSLLVGMLLGEKYAIDDDTRADLNATGTTHLVIVDGTNTAIFIAFLALIGQWLGIRRRGVWLGVSLAAIAAFAFLAGGDAPVVRAGMMGVGALIAPLVGRRADGLVWLGLAAALIASHDPTAVSTLAFLYSFLATVGVVAVAPWLARRMARIVAFAAHPHLISVLSVTVGAQLMTEPLAWHAFGRVSLVSPLVHLFVEPFVPALMLLTLATALGGLLPVPVIGAAVGLCAALPAWVCLQIIHAGASLPAAAPTLPQLSAPLTAALYAVPLCGIAAAHGATLRQRIGSIHLGRATIGYVATFAGTLALLLGVVRLWSG